VKDQNLFVKDQNSCTQSVIDKNLSCMRPVKGSNSACMRSVKDQARTLEVNGVTSKDAPWVKIRNGRRFIEMTIDSGAAATVAPKGAFDDPMMRTSRTESEVFATASGHRMPNYGEQRIQAKSHNGVNMNITAQVTDVKKPLISVQEMCKKGNHVIFKDDGPIIRNEKSGIEIEMIQRNGQYIIELEVNGVEGDSVAAVGSTFSRPEQNLR